MSLDEMVGPAIRAHRTRLGLSAKDLAGRVAAAGGKLSRQAISKLELGCRGVTLGEVMILARVMQVSPTILIFPRGAETKGQVLVGNTEMPAGEAARWFSDIQFCVACGGNPPAGFTCNACGRHDLQRVDDRGELTAGVSVETHEPAKQQRRRVTPSLLAQVAECYRSELDAGRQPLVGIEAHFSVSHSTAGRWVVEARKAGLLGPAVGTVAGEKSPTA